MYIYISIYICNHNIYIYIRICTYISSHHQYFSCIAWHFSALVWWPWEGIVNRPNVKWMSQVIIPHPAGRSFSFRSLLNIEINFLLFFFCLGRCCRWLVKVKNTNLIWWGLHVLSVDFLQQMETSSIECLPYLRPNHIQAHYSEGDHQ